MQELSKLRIQSQNLFPVSYTHLDVYKRQNQHYLDELSQKQISALIIKTTKPDEKLPDSLIESGSSLSIPVIGLSPDVRFIDVISSVMNEIQKNKNKYYTDIQNDMTHRLASGANEQDLLDMLARYIPAPVSYTHLDVYKRQVECRNRRITSWLRAQHTYTGGYACPKPFQR